MTTESPANAAPARSAPYCRGVALVLDGSQPMNFSTQAFYHAESLEFSPDWSFRFQLLFPFPR